MAASGGSSWTVPVATRPSERVLHVEVEGGADAGPGVDRDQEGDRADRRHRRDGERRRAGSRSRRCTAGVRQRPMKPPITPPAIAAIRPVIAASGKREAGQGLTTQTCDQTHSAARPIVPMPSPASAPKLIGRSAAGSPRR